MTCGVYRWMEWDDQMTGLKHFPCCCGGLCWTVTNEFCGSGITEEFYRGFLGFGADAAGPRAMVGCVLSVDGLVDMEVQMAYEKWPSTSLRKPQKN